MFSCHLPAITTVPKSFCDSPCSTNYLQKKGSFIHCFAEKRSFVEQKAKQGEQNFYFTLQIKLEYDC